MTPLVSIVIPCFNNARFVGETIKSILQQRYSRLEIIAIDDGSTDDSLNVIKSFGDKITWRTGENAGACAARNRGLEIARGDLIMFLDADDFIEGPLIKGLVDSMITENADIGFAPCRLLYPDERKTLARSAPNFESSTDIIIQWLAYSRGVNSCSVMWKTDYLLRIGGWDLRAKRNQDGEVALRAVLLGARFATSTEGAGVYRLSPPNASISGRSDNLTSLLYVGEKLRNLRSEVVSRNSIDHACSLYFYNCARQCYAKAQYRLGDHALRRSRELGFRGYRGNYPFQVLQMTLGLNNIYRLLNFSRTIAAHVKYPSFFYQLQERYFT